MSTTTNPTVSNTHELGKLLLRVTLGALLLVHGITKVGAGVDWIGGMLQQAGLPGVLAYGVYVGELLAPLLLIAGLWTRTAAAIIVVNMLFAVGLVHLGDFGKLTQVGAWALETQALYLFGAAAVALLGPGRIAVGRLNARLA